MNLGEWTLLTLILCLTMISTQRTHVECREYATWSDAGRGYDYDAESSSCSKITSVITLDSICQCLESITPPCVVFHEVSSFATLWAELKNNYEFDLNLYDMFLAPAYFLEDFTSSSSTPLLLELSDYLRKDTVINWADVFSGNREAVAYDYTLKDIFALPVSDGNRFLVYRKDIFAGFPETAPSALPVTWDGLAGLNTEIPDFSCYRIPRQVPPNKSHALEEMDLYPLFLSIAASFMQVEGEMQGFLFDKNTFEPRLEEKGFVKSLEMVKSLFVPIFSNTSNDKGPLDNFRNGNCAYFIGTAAEAILAASTQMNTGITIVPGTDKVFVSSTSSGEGLINCTIEKCPHAEYDPLKGIFINRAPISSTDLIAGVIAGSSAENMDEAYDLAAYISTKVPTMRMIDTSGIGIGYRESQVVSSSGQTYWKGALNVSDEFLASFNYAVKKTASSGNKATGMKIIEGINYFKVFMEPALQSYILNETGVALDTLKGIKSDWEQLTEGIGVQTQKLAYLRSLGYDTNPEPIIVGFNYSMLYFIYILTFAVLLEFIIIVVLFAIFRESNIYFKDGKLFLVLSMIGCVIMVVAVIFLILPQPEYYNVFTCMLPVWLVVIGFALAYLSVFIKSYRSYVIFVNLTIERAKGNVAKLLLVEVIGLAIGVLILIGFTIQSPLDATIEIKDSLAEKSCKSENMYIWGTAIQLYCFIILSLVLYMALQVRKVLDVSTESRYIIPAVFISISVIVANAVALEIVDSNGIRVLFLSLSAIIIAVACANFQFVSIYLNVLLRRLSKDKGGGAESSLGHAMKAENVERACPHCRRPFNGRMMFELSETELLTEDQRQEEANMSKSHDEEAAEKEDIVNVTGLNRTVPDDEEQSGAHDDLQDDFGIENAEYSDFGLSPAELMESDTVEHTETSGDEEE